MPIPALLVTGATGAGKTTMISRLLAQRPPAERWAVLVNDFGKVELASAPGVAEGKVVVREVAGCICCVGQVALRTALVNLLRQVRPARLVIEASAAAHPSSIVEVLSEPGIAPAVSLKRILCVVDPRHLLDARHADNALYREQAATADAVIMSGTGAQHTEALRALAALDAPKTVPEGITLSDFEPRC